MFPLKWAHQFSLEFEHPENESNVFWDGSSRKKGRVIPKITIHANFEKSFFKLETSSAPWATHPHIRWRSHNPLDGRYPRLVIKLPFWRHFDVKMNVVSIQSEVDVKDAMWRYSSNGPWSHICGGWRHGVPGLQGVHTEVSQRPPPRPGWVCPITGGISSLQTSWLWCRQSRASTRMHSNLQKVFLKGWKLSLTWFMRFFHSKCPHIEYRNITEQIWIRYHSQVVGCCH